MHMHIYIYIFTSAFIRFYRSGSLGRLCDSATLYYFLRQTRRELFLNLKGTKNLNQGPLKIVLFGVNRTSVATTITTISRMTKKMCETSS